MGELEIVNDKPVCTEEGWGKAVYWEPNTIEEVKGRAPTVRIQKVNPRDYMER